MATHSDKVPSVDALGHTARVEISAVDPGGWDVTATLDGRIVAARHCRDWHRTERARAAMTSELLALARRLVEVGALLALLVGGPAGVTHAQDVPAATPSPADSGPTAIFAEPRTIARGIDFVTRTLGDGSEVKSGFYLETSNMPTGAGWITAGPGYRYWLFGDQMFIDGSAAVSWRAYKMAQARIEMPQLAKSRLVLGTQVRWQDLTQVSYFGDGADSLETDRSEYRLKSTNIAGYATVRPTPWLSVGGRIGWLDRPSLGAPAGTFQRGNPPTQEVFPGDPVYRVVLATQLRLPGSVDRRRHPQPPWPSDDWRALSSRVGRLHRSGSGRVQLPPIRSGGGSLHTRLAFASGVRDARLAGGIPHRRRGMGAVLLRAEPRRS